MKKITLAIALLIAPAVAQAWPWSKDMSEQISIKPQESVDPAHPGMATYPERSVPVPGTTSFVQDMDGADKQKNPVVANQKSIEFGGGCSVSTALRATAMQARVTGWWGRSWYCNPTI